MLGANGQGKRRETTKKSLKRKRCTFKFSLPTFMVFIHPPDPALRQPSTATAGLPLFSSFYLLAVLAILPNTFLLKLLLLPFIIWQAWKKPLRRYELLNGLPIERPLSFSNVLIDAFDLICNARGIGWSWSHTPFPRQGTLSPSITSILVKLLLKCTLIDASQHIIHIVCPSVNNPGGGSLFDPNLGPIRSTALAAFAAIWGGLFPASHWPPFLRRPWMSTSIREFWSYRWHQALRHLFTVLGARPGGALLGLPGAIMGAFGVSAVLHHVGLWGLGSGMEFSTLGGFFLFMGLGVVMERYLRKRPGCACEVFLVGHGPCCGHSCGARSCSTGVLDMGCL
ncbi:hypothetical protein BGW80DRAFT_1530441 [Lactifluus volemus]|nr:hypothetical protein BGW80DRAFT_1530441 [Lactifluus volemus]